MRKVVAALLVTTLTVSACGSIRESRFNPFNWFGASRATAADTAPEGEVNPLIPRRSGFFARSEAGYQGQTLASVTELVVERLPGGAVIRVEGMAQRADAYNIRLVRDESAPDDTLAYALQAEFPRPSRDTIQRQRRVITAVHLSDQDLDGIRRIRVTGLENAREARR